MPQTHVIILGHVFPYEEKSPFVKSGVSVFGAVEYDPSSDRLKCHECGEWFEFLGKHVLHHGPIAEYKSRHGLRKTAPLLGLAMRKKRSNKLKLSPIHSVDALRRCRAGVVPKKTLNSEEERNMRGKCFAQAAFKITMLARGLGRTPTKDEIHAAGIGGTALLRAAKSFGIKSHNEAMASIGLKPNPKGHKASFNDRMPRPDEYFKGILPEHAFSQKIG